MKNIFILLSCLCLIVGFAFFLLKNESTNPNSQRAADATSSSSEAEKISTPQVNRNPASQKSSSSEQEQRALSYLQKNSKTLWQSLKDSNGKITAFVGGQISHVGADVQSVYSFSKEIANRLGVSPESLSSDALVANEHPDFVKYLFHQEVGSYKVYRSHMSVMARKSDNSIYIINNQLKNVPTSISPTVKFDAKGAEGIFTRQYAGRNPQNIEIENQPVLWVDSEKPELAWLLTAELRAPYDRLEVLVGNDSGKIIYSKSRLRK